MLNIRIIRRKIRTVQNIQKMTSAMKLVAAAHLRRVEEKVEAGRPYSEKMREIVARLAPQAAGVEHPLLARRQLKRALLVAMASNRGLCGSYNANLNRTAMAHLEKLIKDGVEVSLITIGRRVQSFFSRRGYKILESFDTLSAESSQAEIRSVSESIRGMYEREEVDQVDIAYTRFISTILHSPTIVQLLPIETETETPEGQRVSEYIFEPPPARLFALLLPRYVDAIFYHLLLESTTSEHAARMMAMTQATQNAEEMIEDLILSYHKSRQASITSEMLDVIGGAEAFRS